MWRMCPACIKCWARSRESPTSRNSTGLDMMSRTRSWGAGARRGLRARSGAGDLVLACVRIAVSNLRLPDRSDRLADEGLVAADTGLGEPGELFRHGLPIMTAARDDEFSSARAELVLEHEEARGNQAVQLVAREWSGARRFVEDLAGDARDAVVVEKHDLREERLHLRLVTHHLRANDLTR